MSSIQGNTNPDPSPCEHLSYPPKQVVVARNGDLHVVVGRHRCRRVAPKPFIGLEHATDEDGDEIDTDEGDWDEEWDDIESQFFIIETGQDEAAPGPITIKLEHVVGEDDSDFDTDEDDWDEGWDMDSIEDDSADELTEDDQAATSPHYHDRAVDFVVSSEVLSHASPFFREMILSYREAGEPRGGPEGNEKWTFHLPDDDPDCMAVLFHLAHENYGQVPRGRDMSSELFYQITLAADKYTMIPLLIPGF